jgi:predicted DNA-binding protein
MKLTNVRFPEKTLERIDALVGANRRAQFIREVVERELERIEKAETTTKT